jgi:hypothetical protein
MDVHGKSGSAIRMKRAGLANLCIILKPHDTTCLKLEAITHGHSAIENNKRAPKNINGLEALYPSVAACMAPTPNKRIGIVNGMISSAIRTPDRLEPRTSAAPTAPRRLIIGVPKAILVTKYRKAPVLILSINAKTGEIAIIGKPVVNQ